MKNYKGITLIALVVTIVVLLILAGISIGMLAGENGIVRQTQKSKDVSRIEGIKEQIKLWREEQNIDRLTEYNTARSEDVMLNDMQKGGLITEEEKTKLQNGQSITIGKGKEWEETISIVPTLVEMFKSAQQANCKGGEECTAPSVHLHIGDYVEYIPVEGNSVSVSSAETGNYATVDGVLDLTELEPQTYTVNMNTTWRVLGLNKNGTEIMLTSGSPIRKDGDDPYLILGGAEAYEYGEEVLNKVAKVYHNDKYAVETRSINVDDINNALNIVLSENKMTQNGVTIINAVYTEKTYVYKEGNITLNNYFYDRGNTEKTRKKVGDGEKGSVTYAYSINDSIIDKTSELYDVLFFGTMRAEKCAKSYWLASTGINIFSSNGIPFAAGFGIGFVNGGVVYKGILNTFNSDKTVYVDKLGVKPIITLKYSITANDLNVVSYTEKNEEEWTTNLLNFSVYSGNTTLGTVDPAE